MHLCMQISIALNVREFSLICVFIASNLNLKYNYVTHRNRNPITYFFKRSPHRCCCCCEIVRKAIRIFMGDRVTRHCLFFADGSTVAGSKRSKDCSVDEELESCNE